MSNILTAVFGNGRSGSETETRTASAWQYDYGMVLKFEGLDLPLAYEVHFANSRRGDSVTSIGGSDGVAVPDAMFLTGETIYAWVYLHTGESDGETQYMAIIPVHDRAKPTNEEPTPVQQDVITQTIAALQDGLTKGPKIIGGQWYTWDAEHSEFVNTEVSASGIDRIVLNQDYTLTFYYTKGDSYTTGSIRGQAGFSPYVEVTEIAGGHRVSVTDESGAHSFDVMDGEALIDDSEVSASKSWSSSKINTTKVDKENPATTGTLSHNRKTGTTVGNYSVALGINGTASGYASTAEGEGTTAISSGAHAEGHGTTASNAASHAEGGGTTASGMHSHSEGAGTTASGADAHSEGAATIASGAYSHAEGEQSKAQANASHSEGYKTEARSNYSHAEGRETIASGEKSHAEGYSATASGENSHAEGAGTTASGDNSHAEGAGCTASDSNAHAEGAGTTASHANSHAEGAGTKAQNYQAHAEGTNTTASGVQSHAEGWGTTASGNSSHAEGSGTTASGIQSHAEGASTNATQDNAHAEGANTKAQNYQAHAEGSSTTASGYSSHAEGSGATASGYTSHAEGSSTNASGSNAHAEGASTTASGANAHAEGAGTYATNSQAHAEGAGTTASGYQSHAEGTGTTASGSSSHAEGSGGSAYGDYSHVEGCGTIANRQSQHTFGNYNVIDASGANSGSRGEYIEIVGNGTSNGRSNARTLDWNGNERIAGSLYVECNSNSSGGKKVVTETENNKKANSILCSISEQNVASFSDAAEGIPFDEFILHIDPVQDLSGGNPSPTHVCPITGFADANIYHAPTYDPDDPDKETYNIVFSYDPNSYVYVAELNVKTGVLTAIHKMEYLSGFNFEKAPETSSTGGSCFRALLSQVGDGMAPRAENSKNTMLCDMYATCGDSIYSVSDMPDFSVMADSTYLYVTDSRYSTAQQFYNACRSNGAVIVYELATPATYQQTIADILPLFGNNNIWATTGKIKSLKYTADTKLYIDQKFAALQALIEGN